MKINDHLIQATNRLAAANIGTARLDALVLLEDELGRDRSWILAHLEDEVGKLSKKFTQNLQRRETHEPLAYIRGKSEFYGREFIVNKHVLVPRPESETMIELLKQLMSSIQLTADSSPQIVDVGTGSGALAITAKLELPDSLVTAIDIDNECLKVTKKNTQKHGVNIDIIKSNLLSKLPTITRTPSAILANLPYVPDTHTINKAAMQEPSQAIFGGQDGLNLYRRLFDQLKTGRMSKPIVLTESLPPQHKELSIIAEKAGYQLTTAEDFIQVFLPNS